MIKEIDVQELKSKLDNKENFVFIDCREQEEWNEAHIEGATLIPLSTFQEKYETVLTDKNAPIVVQCRSGKRSMNACMFLLSKGFSDLNNLEGGIMAWQEAGFPVKA
ncbi:rhodanese-like domain-containing protein [Bacteriovorax stolpii]|uniref:NADH oxidase n=1 Tax=Bacteriovorax stolpii TaxID=960 RepID=A0A2K9NVZ2_BACTC|nr:rhodanese-like domain-containing protein [Bacteriovorax stolpii]AUN99676.1 NADH oxidase [Bacteriovorax stolpii]QDK40327.1 rhodanese-like domain-containing protein [Bacteriovorax stolpii]TDP51308.1 rhodanese-related sulfurtransferase [Bacteriovorax stolpii]